MKFPQAFVFFNYKSAVTLADVQSLYGPATDIEFFPSGHTGDSAIERRLMVARQVSETCRPKYTYLGPCAVIQTNELNSFFLLKYSANIEDTVWYSTSQDFIRLRSALTIKKNFWNYYWSIDATTTHHNRIAEVLGQDCPEFKRDHRLMESLKNYRESLDTGAIHEAMKDRIRKIAHVGKQQI